MNLSKLQITVVIGSITLLLILVALNLMGYTVSTTKKGQPTEDNPADFLTEEIVLADARNTLDSSQTAWLTYLDQEKAQAATIEEEAEVLKLISRTWYENGNYLASGYYAKKVAELLQTGDAWSIAGTTYAAAFSAGQKNDIKQLAAQKAIEALAKAKALQPDSLQHRINEGLMYLELSSVDARVMPMKGVRLLQALDQEFPNNVRVNMTLGRLSATRSGDLAKAKPRFEKVLEIAETKPVVDEILLEAHYFLIDCYKQEENSEKVLYHYNKMDELSAGQPAVQAQMKRAKEQYLDRLHQEK
ncbi:MAG: tetratricopeptide repeat protein [Aureispira sp.]